MNSTWFWYPDESKAWLPGELVAGHGEEEMELRALDGSTVRIARSTAVPALESSVTDARENLVDLEELSEGAILHQLRLRYQKSQIYTNIGPILVSINPYRVLPIYSSATLAGYANGEQTSPHIFLTAAQTLNGLTSSLRNQSVIISGESGAGKTEATKLILQYLSETSGSASGVEQKVLQTNPILEAFGNAKTVRNNNSSRFGKWMEVHFSDSLTISGSSVSSYLLEKSRVVSQAKGERNYHVFYQLCEGAPADIRERYNIGRIEEYSYLSGGSVSVDGMSDGSEFSKVYRAMQALGFTLQESEEVWLLLAMILNLGELVFSTAETSAASEGSQIANRDRLTMIASQLEVDPSAFEQSLCFRSVNIVGEVSLIPLSPDQAREGRDALAKTVYNALFSWIVERLNRVLAPPKEGGLRIGILDIFGFEIFDHNLLEQFFINYANEKLQGTFTDFIFKVEQEEYKREGIDVSFVDFPDNASCLALIEGSQPGILQLIDEEAVMPKGSDDSLIEKMHAQFHRSLNHENYGIVRKAPERFCIHHYAGTVEYDSQGFVDKNKDKVHELTSKMLASTAVPILKAAFGEKKLDSIDEEEDNKRGGSRRNKKKNQSTLAGQFRTQLHDLVTNIGATDPHFVRCLKPNAQKKAEVLEEPMVLWQMKYSGLMEAVSVRKSGYPFRIPHSEFVSRYRVLRNILSGDGVNSSEVDGDAPAEKRASDLLALIASSSSEDTPFDYQVGGSKVFLRDNGRCVFVIVLVFPSSLYFHILLIFL